jgi:uncharacterized protein YdiU (UPF0061 family)
MKTFNFEETYCQQSEDFFRPATPLRPSRPELIAFNHPLALELGFESQKISPENLAKLFSGAEIPSGAHPVALAYAGHQFGHFVPQLGDGRAILLGEVTSLQGKRYDIQLKGPGPTFFSRGGDGKSPLGPVLREYLVSEAMHALGVPTTRSLCAVTTGDSVYREEELPGAVLTRVASSHLRVGTFQYFAARADHVNLRKLADYAINRHYPECRGDYLAFLNSVIARQIALVVQWMGLGFIHGVMNTDNTSISGETLDFGPCAFMDEFQRDKKYSYIDRNGRYAYANQGRILQWNMARLAECLVPLLGENENEKTVSLLNQRIQQIKDQFDSALEFHFARKLGLPPIKINSVGPVTLWLDYLEKHQLDFTESFRLLPDLLQQDSHSYFPACDLFKHFMLEWQKNMETSGVPQDRIIAEMKKLNPVYIPRNHLVEKIIQDAVAGHYDTFHVFHKLWQKPFERQNGFDPVEQIPSASERVAHTFCGT